MQHRTAPGSGARAMLRALARSVSFRAVPWHPSRLWPTFPLPNHHPRSSVALGMQGQLGTGILLRVHREGRNGWPDGGQEARGESVLSYVTYEIGRRPKERHTHEELHY